MPVVFLGHGSPMNAIQENEFHHGMSEIADRLPRPKAVLCISAHWETRGARVTASLHPETIHDFQGFPMELFAVRYPAPGDPSLARRVAELLSEAKVALDPDRGLDHGCWGCLRIVYPVADIPVVQLSLDTTSPPWSHLHLAKRLAPLREEGVLIMGSGNIVHNLRRIDFHRPDGADWAERFNDEVKKRILAGDGDALTTYQTLTPEAFLAVPSLEHFLPLLYVVAQRQPKDRVCFFNDKTVMGSISMTSVVVGDLAV
jgi:4,5-DOPA dioxygenase extradiol